MARFGDRFTYCPYCGKRFRYECECPYGKHVKMKLDFDERLKELYRKRFCPWCGSRSTKMECPLCKKAFDSLDMFY